MSTIRENIRSILQYQGYEHIPVMHFGFWKETIEKWFHEGHLTKELAQPVMINNESDGNDAERKVAQILGFDDNALVYTGQKGDWYDVPLYPSFKEKKIKSLGNNDHIQLNSEGVQVLVKDGCLSIPQEIEHTLKDRESWEKEYLPRLQWTEERLDYSALNFLASNNNQRDRHLAIYCGSLYGKLRNFWGLEAICYLHIDDPDLLMECVNAVGEISYKIVENTLKTGVKPDFGHFWEDICYKNGPLIHPDLFRQLTAKHYRKITDLLNKNNINIVSVDCDGYIEDLVPIWLDNGVNTMFPVEFGSWEYDFSVLRRKFGKTVRGIGNINKNVLGMDRHAIDREIERAKRLVDLGGFLPCLDHRIPVDAEWDLTRYYCDQMRKAFS